MATYPTNDQLISVTTKRTIPDLQVNLTGTITAAANSIFLNGTGTSFLTQIGGNQGLGLPSITAELGWVVDLTNNEIRRIDQVVDNTHLVLETPFTNIQTASTLAYVKASRAKAMGVSFATAGGVLNGVTLPALYSVKYENESDSEYIIDPQIIDGSAATGIVNIKYPGR